MKKIEMKNTITEKQEKAWFDAVILKNIKTIQRMLKEGIDVNTEDKRFKTALHYTAITNNGATEIMNLLIDNGADVNKQDENGWTPLHNACFWGDIEMAKLLISKGTDINIRDSHGDTFFSLLKNEFPATYIRLAQWLSEEYPEKMLELMVSENSPSKGLGL